MYDEIRELVGQLGLVLAPKKCVPPTEALEWLGFHISAPDMTLSIPEDKMAEVLAECHRWQHKKTASRKDLQSLVSRLQNADIDGLKGDTIQRQA